MAMAPLILICIIHLDHIAVIITGAHLQAPGFSILISPIHIALMAPMADGPYHPIHVLGDGRCHIMVHQHGDLTRGAAGVAIGLV